ncbi:hypothetical protein A3F00_04845 [Candidatus Daviesbacteria bacterium RIFCSPHIGHO2_12_FULL_37_11]|uniref:Uncharacterized protein n=1 Tax=Candidatus Daviesbacteria bacterium RIFCSPHIGHO2_12_FULL_37_11 TaxID=1797777 RepID=A0A1F5KAW7_9BACT|nr:MAG: hypothetical protein A2769_01740 [Candidatus Daviesbacteria bacterium RIFCSPHIGHO2_01_FULL_37_27]OGE38096.1 MAG: hypothetical protein A3F00_04845 [Candidatus Daviesbacteria bacterium RIFCSPHIGHO2_12_FULL_37_11]OGE44950.1 MAG: hypothetical protein A3B39_02535 [Candidatus Daviesbacteria bacterium RIFCSPLOWO2_01_FULL_37_10]
MSESVQNQGFVEATNVVNDSRVHRLAQDFYDAVKESRRFQWMGLSSAKDELNRSRLIIHLAEDDRPEKEHSQNENLSAISVSLAITALQSDRSFIVDLYYFMESVSEIPFAERSLEAIKTRYGTLNHDPKPEFLWEEYFSPSQSETD